MNFTFGIITVKGNEDRINIIIDSIEKQNINDYEVVVIGNVDVERKNTSVIEFDENVKSMWITRKKNLITSHAKYDNIVYMHDYIKLDDSWYTGWKTFGEDYYACMNVIENYDGNRYRDWSLFPPFYDGVLDIGKEALIPYDIDTKHINKLMYFSGAYWVAKKEIMKQIPLDEQLVWGQGEDVKWSRMFSSRYDFSINSLSRVKIFKGVKDRAFDECTMETIEKIKKYKDCNNNKGIK
tara:strand:+ start:5130 stop:5843 length:714 start_codon:yes stop_codon:yes gene_type:complete